MSGILALFCRCLLIHVISSQGCNNCSTSEYINFNVSSQQPYKIIVKDSGEHLTNSGEIQPYSTSVTSSTPILITSTVTQLPTMTSPTTAIITTTFQGYTSSGGASNLLIYVNGQAVTFAGALIPDVTGKLISGAGYADPQYTQITSMAVIKFNTGESPTIDLRLRNWNSDSNAQAEGIGLMIQLFGTNEWIDIYLNDSCNLKFLRDLEYRIELSHDEWVYPFSVKENQLCFFNSNYPGSRPVVDCVLNTNKKITSLGQTVTKIQAHHRT